VSRFDAELELLRSFYPNLEYRAEGHWVLLPRYGVPTEGQWTTSEVAVAFQMPVGLPGQAPYGFYVTPALVHSTGTAPQHAAAANEAVPWAGAWIKFSWSPESWQPTADMRSGSNMLQFAISVADRLRQGV